MTSISLTDPVDGTVAEASLIAANNTLLENAINGALDDGNIAPGASIAGSKLADGSIPYAKLAQWQSARAHGTFNVTADGNYRTWTPITKVSDWETGATFFHATNLNIVIPTTGYYYLNVHYQAFANAGTCRFQPVIAADTDFMSCEGTAGPDASFSGPRGIGGSIVRNFTAADQIYPGGSHSTGGNVTVYMTIIRLPL